MNQIRSATLLVVLVVMVGIAVGQSNARNRSKLAPRATATPVVPLPAKRAVIIHFNQGLTVKGAFLRADSETVQIETVSGRLTLKMNEIASLDFANSETAATKPREEAPQNPPAATPTPVPAATRKAYLALRKLADAAQIGLPYLQYGNLLLEIKPTVEEVLTTLPENALKAEMAQALEAYTEAGQAWGAMHASGILQIASEPGATLMKKYEIKPSVNGLGQTDHLRLDVTLSTIWAAAAKHLDNVAAMLRL
ncbi:MAG: hypothetical protein HYR56_06970 [Acidobacteria bacterium]|nr:hypothetical protein [Acidobacteriota bacterium]MBI3425083.1 hypothetical protein [Acidobacteriota bacterium]